MKVIVCGAGLVGSNIARYLAAENNDVTVVDQSSDLVRRLSDTADVQGVVGHAAHPSVLEQAGAESADMLIAVTYADEVNMVACQVAHAVFAVPTKIARVRHQDYLQPIWSRLFSRDHMAIDVVISPEIEVARAVTRRVHVPGTIEMSPLVQDRVRLLGVRLDPTCPVVNTPLRQLTQLFPDLNIIVVGILRDDRAFVPTADDQMQVADQVFFVVDSEQVRRAMAVFGHEEVEAKRLVVFGGGNIGLFLAEQIERDYPWINAKLVEANRERAEFAASRLKRTVVIHGSVLEPEILDEAEVGSAETVVAVTNDDETNILASLLAKREGCERAITLVNKGNYESLAPTLGIDAVINPRVITVSSILQHVRRGRIHSAHALREGFGELIEAEALPTSGLVGAPLRDIKLPDGVLIGAVVRGSQVIIPRGSTTIQAKDRVVLFATTAAIRDVENMFSVRLEYF